ncbi:hypothetical protein KUTG_00008 [Kutzneria sp. 744]|nr:hypothetical protein KUTG_00008 [Kutzneria sp. 744]
MSHRPGHAADAVILFMVDQRAYLGQTRLLVVSLEVDGAAVSSTGESVYDPPPSCRHCIVLGEGIA